MEIRLAETANETLAWAAEELRLGLTRAGYTGEAVFTLAIESPATLADDRIAIAATAAGGRLAGSNPRSVLFAVYRYLRECGYRWPRPGADGELVPDLSRGLPTVNVAEPAAYRFRTICIEGACSEQHVLDLIDWATRHGMNGYFLQFDYGTTFWRSWATHEGNPEWAGEPVFGPTEAAAIVERLTAAIARRGLWFERVGHGWTGRALGLESESWDSAAPALSPERQQMLAEIDGQRQLFRGVALNTNLCYGSPEVRRRLVADVVAYAVAHPEVDLLHYWLADGTNNHCECAVCRERRPADWYVMLLNEIDDALTARGLATRLVFLIYVDLLWPSERERLRRPERFVLMFAPITRSFQYSFADARVPTGELPPYVRNRLVFPRDVGANLQLLRAWQEQFTGQAFDFDYHLCWAEYYDLAQISIAEVLHRDLRHLAAMGLHGYNSCQIQRVGFPHNLVMAVLADTLWNPQTSFASIVDDWFAAAFGPEGAPQVIDFFTTLSALWAPCFGTVYQPDVDRERQAQGLANLARVPELAAAMRPAVDRGLTDSMPVRRRSWEYVGAFLDLLTVLVPAFEAYLRESPDCRARFEAVCGWIHRHERELAAGLDGYRLQTVLRWRPNELEAWQKGVAATAGVGL